MPLNAAPKPRPATSEPAKNIAVECSSTPASVTTSPTTSAAVPPASAARAGRVRTASTAAAPASTSVATTPPPISGEWMPVTMRASDGPSDA